MYIVDANVLLYAVNKASPHHKAARTWLDNTLYEERLVGFAWIVLLGFLRISTRKGIFEKPLSTRKALDTMNAWLSNPSAVIVHPTPRHASILAGLLSTVGTAGNLTSDAHLAALASEYDAEIISFDSDFDRFEGVRFSRP